MVASWHLYFRLLSLRGYLQLGYNYSLIFHISIKKLIYKNKNSYKLSEILAHLQISPLIAGWINNYITF